MVGDRLKNWLWLWVLMTFYSFAGVLTFGVLSDQGIPEAPSTMADAGAPLLALSGALLGLVAETNSRGSVWRRAQRATIWIVAIFSAYFWLASAESVNRHPGDVGFVVDILKLFDFYIFIGLFLTILVEASRAYWRSSQTD